MALKHLLFLLMTGLSAEPIKEKIFTKLYETKAWGTNQEGFGSSGPESALDLSHPYIDFLQNFMQTNNIQSVVDAGCGDWSFSKAINWDKIRYTGIDIVKPVIERNGRFASPNISFMHGDMNEIELPAADLLICKDVLQYLSNNEVQQFLGRLKNYKYCLLTNDVMSAPFNRTIVSGDHRPLDLTRPPFNIQGAKIFTYKAGPVTKQVLLKVNETETPPPAKRCYAINKIHSFQGFFSLFLTVINYLDLYDKGCIDGLVVDFKNYGLYYEAAYGPNWWGYYFEPLKLGIVEGVDTDYSEPKETGRVSILAEIGLTKERIAELVRKYVHVKPEITKEIDQIVSEKFSGKYLIGVHYRGTDKFKSEAKSITYDSLSTAIQQYIDENKLTDYLIFVASDEEPFLSYMEKTFEGKIISQSCLRSADNKPIHYFNKNNTSPYRLGKEAVIDCLLLSKCNHLIRTSSCLSLASTFFNPDITETLLNQRLSYDYTRF